MALGSGGGGVVTLLGGCRSRVIVHATPSGAAIAASKITGMITASRYATRCGRCTGGRCGAPGGGGAGCGGPGCGAVDCGGVACGGVDCGGGAAMNGCDSSGGAHLGSTLDMRQGSEVAVQVPGDEGGGKAAGLPRYMISHVMGVAPAALEQRTQQTQGLGIGPGRS